jgi:LuxR family maltose regulon positive regulatory protein
VVRLAELRRRQGRVGEAADLFAEAERHALAELGVGALRLDEGDAAGARDHLERALRQLPVQSATKRTGLLELMARALAALGEPEAARPYVDELDAIAKTVATMPLRASASLAAGVVATAAGEHETARRRLEDAIELFARGGAPFETAHARLELADVLVAMGRSDEAAREAAAALRRCDELGAGGQSARARALLGGLGRTPDGRDDGPLTTRQVEVLRLVADGLSDRQIAARLSLSEHTVHRHLQNTYARLRCRSRAAAVAGATRLRLL